nr:bacteriophage abortive infection AbiH family protein [Bacillus cereus]
MDALEDVKYGLTDFVESSIDDTKEEFRDKYEFIKDMWNNPIRTLKHELDEKVKEMYAIRNVLSDWFVENIEYGDADNELVLGHSNSSRIDYFNKKYIDYQNRLDEQMAPIYNVLTDYCSKTYKNVNNYIYKLSSLNFDAVERVIIIGHSLGDVDLPYFKEVKERVNENTEWHVYYYSENDIENFRDKLTQIGIIEQYIKFIHCDTFYDLPLVEQTIEN